MIGVVLAGGLSSRMGGGDKSLLTLNGRPILQMVLDRLAPQVDKIIINANGDPERFSGFGCPIVADTIEGFAGPLAGVLAGMDYAATKHQDSIVTVAADTPFFPTNLVDMLNTAGTFSMAATPDPKRGIARHPTFAKWPVALREDLRAGLNNGVRKVIAWSDPAGCVDVMFDVAQYDPFFNVNRPDDMKQAEQMVQEYGL